MGRPVARSRPPNRGCLLRLGQAPEAYAYAVEKFAVMGRIFDPSLEKATDDVAAEKSCDVLDGFLKEIDIGLSLKGLGVREEEVVLIADHSQVLPDYKNNPRVATRDEIYEILMNSYQRE